MDYRQCAEELLSLQVQLHLSSLDRQVSHFSQGMYVALQYLSICNGAAHPRELSREMAVSSARVAALLNRMESQGLVKRRPDTADSRQVIISITEKGAQRLREMRQQLICGLAALLEAIGPEDAAAYLRIRRKMADALQRDLLPRGGDETRKDESTLV